MKTKEFIENGIAYCQLTPENGYLIKDSRTGLLHTEVICRKEDVKFFSAVELPNE